MTLNAAVNLDLTSRASTRKRTPSGETSISVARRSAFGPVPNAVTGIVASEAMRRPAGSSTLTAAQADRYGANSRAFASAYSAIDPWKSR